MASQERVRVRIAVAIDDTGLWSAVGNCAYEDDQEAIDAANDYLPSESSPCRQVVWVEADIPVPDSEVVEGKVIGGRGLD